MYDEPPVIWWARRDLRLDDNPALVAALRTGRPVIPVFVWAPEEEGQFQQGRYSRWWTKHSVVRFQQVLQQVGSRLIIRRASETSRGLMQVVNETKAQAVFFNHLYDPISLVRDHEVKSSLTKLGIQCSSYNADLLYEPWDVLDSSKQPFTSFASFWDRVLEMPSPPPFPLPAPQQLPEVSPQLFSVDVQEVDWFMTPEQEASSEQLKFKWKPGVEGAVEKMEAFLSSQLPVFEHDRAKVDRHSTSQLSPWVHMGTISVRYIFYRVCQRQAELQLSGHDISPSCKDFLQQLGYREYSRYLSFHFPFIHERALLAHLRACPWRMDQQHFKAWRQGQTGYPLVDAAMRELWSTGWCHNRMRVVASSFMVKALLLPWQWGLKHFWDAQMDADLECDALGWQYVSGGMSDAHPFDKMLDLGKEAQRFDPDGEYVRRWLPVLSRLPTKYIHAPWTAPPQVLLAADVELGYNYPARIITTEESLANMAHACKVLNSCAAGSGSRTSSHPYRPPTEPLQISKGVTGPSAGSPDRQGQEPAPGSRTHYENGVISGLGDQQQQAPASAAPRKLGVVEEGASVLRPSAGAHVGRRARQREKRAAAVADAPAAVWDVGYEEEPAESGDEAAAASQPGVQDMQEDDMSESDSDAMSDVAMSEEVVSNTVGLSAPQATAWSSRPEEQEGEGEAASRHWGQRHGSPALQQGSHAQPSMAHRQAQLPVSYAGQAGHAAQHSHPGAQPAAHPTTQQQQLRYGDQLVTKHSEWPGQQHAHPVSGSNHGTQTPMQLSMQTGGMSGQSSGGGCQGKLHVPKQGSVPPSSQPPGQGLSPLNPQNRHRLSAAGGGLAAAADAAMADGSAALAAGDRHGVLGHKRQHSADRDGPVDMASEGQ